MRCRTRAQMNRTGFGGEAFLTLRDGSGWDSDRIHQPKRLGLQNTETPVQSYPRGL